jgi:RNA polymerase sigma factor (sigma-70 family)
MTTGIENMISPARDDLAHDHEPFRRYRAATSERIRTSIRNEIVQEHLGLVRQVAGRLARNPDSAEELFAEGCLALVDAIRSFDPERGFRFSTFAVSCIRHRLFRLLKRESRRARTGIPAAATTMSEDDRSLTRLDEDEISGKLHGAIEELPPRQRRLVRLRFGLDRSGESRSFRELASRIGLSKERTRQIVAAALDRLRETLAHSAP